jgi:eukaryotic-like serine/threonine-protein kinase
MIGHIEAGTGRPMSAIDHAQRIESQLDSLLDLPDDQRAEQLAKLERDAPEDAAAAREWLDAMRQSDGYLESARSDSRTRLNPGDAVGVWRLLKYVGHGGMGEVWLAERADGAFDKRVAIKFIRDDTAQLRQTLESERRLLAQLKHPRIANLLDGGSMDNGLPYLVTDYVEGLPIHTWCKAQRPAIAKRLNLFRQVCDAVAYAHSNLIVHRDIKPSNILVDSDGRTHLLDFGIARALQAQGNIATQLSSYGLSPDYAAPEQLTGDLITTRTDIYALGVLLYLLISGRRPLEMPNAPLAVLIKHICVDMPAAPTHLSNLPTAIVGVSRGDLDAITLKALAKAPADRYASVETLLIDLDNAIAHRPIVARQTNRSYIVRRFVRRHRIWISVAVSMILALLIGLVAILREAHIAEQQRDIAKIASDRTRQQRDHTQAMTDFLVTLLGTSVPNDEAIKVSDLMVKARERALDENTDPDQRAAMIQTIINIYTARRDVKSEADFLEPLLTRYVDALPPVLYASSACALGYSKQQMGLLEETNYWIAQGLKYAPDLTADPDSPRIACLRAKAWATRDIDHDIERAMALYRQILDEVEQAKQQTDPEQAITDYDSIYAVSERDYSAALFDTGNMHEALTHSQHALGMLEGRKTGMEELRTDLLGQIAKVENILGQPLRADRMQTRVLAQRKRIAGNSYSSGFELVSAAIYKIQLAEPQAAIALLDQAEPMFRQSLGEHSQYQIGPPMFKGRAYAMLGDREQSLAEFNRAQTLLDDLHFDSRYKFNLLHLRAEASLELDPDQDSARKTLAILIDLQSRLHSGGAYDTRILRSVMTTTAEAAMLAGDWPLAKSNAETARAFYVEQLADPDGSQIARCDVVLAEVMLHAGDRSGAHALFQTSAGHMATSLGPQHPLTLKARASAEASN